MSPTLLAAALVVCVAPAAFVIRLFLQIQAARRRRRQLLPGELPTDSVLGRGGKLLAILGSGGHTAEMLAMLRDVAGDAYADSKLRLDVTCVAADEASAIRARAEAAGFGEVQYLHRARHVGEAWWRAAPRAALCSAEALMLVARVRPDVVLCNGPATGAVVCVAALALNAAGATRARVVYAESVARVQSLSLSGRVLYPVVHRFLVQWPQLARRYPLAEWRGRFT